MSPEKPIEVRVAVLETNMDTLTKGIEKIGEEMDSFRKWRYVISGAVSLLGFIVAVGTPVVVYLATKGPS